MADHTPSDPPPDQTETRSPIDVIVSEGGVMPPARIRVRVYAFVLDYLLLLALCVAIITRIIIPQSYPGTFDEFTTEWFDYVNAPFTEEEGAGMSEEMKATMAIIQEIILLVIWVYFLVGESFFNGSSLGKRVFRLRSVSLITLGPPGLFNGIVRSALKALIVMYWIPLLFLDFLGLLFNKRRQLTHDLLSRTFVMDERYVKEP